MNQLQLILTDLENREITKHQAYDLIMILFDAYHGAGQTVKIVAKTHREYYGKACGNTKMER